MTVKDDEGPTDIAAHRCNHGVTAPDEIVSPPALVLRLDLL